MAWTLWTARLAALLYVLALAVRIEQWRRPERWLWTAAWAVFAAHVSCAFAFVHRAGSLVGRHQLAYADTARQTAALFGFAWGGGLWIDYLFTAVWTLDVTWWWLAPTAYAARPRWASRTLHIFFAFLFFNAVIVFPAGWLRWAGVAAALLLFLRWRQRALEGPPARLRPDKI